MSKVVQFSKGSIIFFEGDKDENIYILQSGAVALRSMDLETGEQISEQLHIGEFFGVKSALAKMPSLVTASVLLDSTVVQLSVYEFEKCLEFSVSRLETFIKKQSSIWAETAFQFRRNTECLWLPTLFTMTASSKVAAMSLLEF